MYLAVAGLHGLILYDIRLKRWRVFGDVTQEQKIQCKGLLWLGKIVVVCNYVDSSNTWDTFIYLHFTCCWYLQIIVLTKFFHNQVVFNNVHTWKSLDLVDAPIQEENRCHQNYSFWLSVALCTTISIYICGLLGLLVLSQVWIALLPKISPWSKLITLSKTIAC